MLDPKKHCVGCYNDFYNGHNGLGVKQCWSLKGAKLVSKLDIHIDLRPPYKGIKPTKRPDCYRRQRYCRVDPKVLTKDGYERRGS